jgi:hypothetical protein
MVERLYSRGVSGGQWPCVVIDYLSIQEIEELGGASVTFLNNPPVQLFQYMILVVVVLRSYSLFMVCHDSNTVMKYRFLVLL